MIDPRASVDLTPERLQQLKDGRDVRHETETVNGGTPGAVPYRPRALHADPSSISPRWPYAVARIYRIGEGAKASTYERSVESSECPKLAKQYLETYAYYMTRTRPPPLHPDGRPRTDHNPFRGLSDYDAMRKFVRAVEDICDRSTGKLGPWYTK